MGSVLFRCRVGFCHMLMNLLYGVFWDGVQAMKTPDE
jgi:hypothetical protein